MGGIWPEGMVSSRVCVRDLPRIPSSSYIDSAKSERWLCFGGTSGRPLSSGLCLRSVLERERDPEECWDVDAARRNVEDCAGFDGAFGTDAVTLCRLRLRDCVRGMSVDSLYVLRLSLLPAVSHWSAKTLDRDIWGMLYMG